MMIIGQSPALDSARALFSSIVELPITARSIVVTLALATAIVLTLDPATRGENDGDDIMAVTDGARATAASRVISLVTRDVVVHVLGVCAAIRAVRTMLHARNANKLTARYEVIDDEFGANCAW
jgi:hypothetical protein